MRKRYAAVQLAMEHLRQGCAYYPEPAFLKLKAAHKMLDEIGQMLSPSKWGR